MDLVAGIGLGDAAGKVFRIGHLGSLADVMTLSGIATSEMIMADLGLPVALDSGLPLPRNITARAASSAQKKPRDEGNIDVYSEAGRHVRRA